MTLSLLTFTNTKINYAGLFSKTLTVTAWSKITPPSMICWRNIKSCQYKCRICWASLYWNHQRRWALKCALAALVVLGRQSDMGAPLPPTFQSTASIFERFLEDWLEFPGIKWENQPIDYRCRLASSILNEKRLFQIFAQAHHIIINY